jgi:hypothetical protein
MLIKRIATLPSMPINAGLLPPDAKVVISQLGTTASTSPRPVTVLPRSPIDEIAGKRHQDRSSDRRPWAMYVKGERTTYLRGETGGSGDHGRNVWPHKRLRALTTIVRAGVHLVE